MEMQLPRKTNRQEQQVSSEIQLECQMWGGKKSGIKFWYDV